MVGRGSRWLHGIGGRILRRVGRDWHPRLRLDGHGLVPLVGSCGVAGWHSLLLWVRRVNHRRGSRGGHNRLWSSTCFVQTATRASEAQNYSNDNHCKNDHSNRNKSSKTHGSCKQTSQCRNGGSHSPRSECSAGVPLCRQVCRLLHDIPSSLHKPHAYKQLELIHCHFLFLSSHIIKANFGHESD